MIIFDGARVGAGGRGGGGGGLTKQGERGRFSRFSLKPPPMTYESSGLFTRFFFISPDLTHTKPIQVLTRFHGASRCSTDR